MLGSVSVEQSDEAARVALLRRGMACVRRNALGLLAVFIALTSSAYAITRMPAGSVGTKQLKNGAVTGNKVAKLSSSAAKWSPWQLRPARFMDSLVDEGFIVLGGPLEGGREILHAISASSEEAVRRRLAKDNWAQNGTLTITSVEAWTVLLDGRST
jgi:hypothetical protein